MKWVQYSASLVPEVWKDKAQMVPILLVPYCPALVKGGLDAPKGRNQAVKESSDYFCCQLLVVELSASKPQR